MQNQRLEHGGDRTDGGPTVRRRKALRRACLVAASLTAAAGGAALYLAHLDARFETGIRPTLSRSPAYLFGFAHAALAGCDFVPGAGLDRLAAAVRTGGQGIVPDEVKAGFGDFHGLQRARGQTDACRQAERFLGPRADSQPGVLMPR
ncbi:MAG: hypothetical protein KJZ80_02885 [Hyphomicrobiaceae bacterium]|nr:hypothetical protein [Hyphomicrobiaceae bacterium]